MSRLTILAFEYRTRQCLLAEPYATCTMSENLFSYTNLSV